MARAVRWMRRGLLAALALGAGVLTWHWIDPVGAGKHAPGSRGDRLERLRAWGVGHRGDLVRDLATMTAVPSVSSQPEGVSAMAELLTRRFEALGMRVENLAGSGPPLLMITGGEFQPSGDAPTVMLYAHYDGQNVDPSRWSASAPFTPTLYPGEFDEGMVPSSLDTDQMQADWRLYGRASADDKGPIAVLLAVLEGLVEEDLGPTAVRVVILLDGEEESGDPHLGATLAAHAHRLRADVLISLDGPVFQTGDPTVVFGVRGITSFDLTVYGAHSDLHSGHYGNWAANPAQELAWIVGGLADPFTGKILVDGFDACRRPLTELEAQAMTEIPDIDDVVERELGLVRRYEGVSLEQAINHPSLNVRGFSAGHVGAHARTVIPAQAEAAFDIRLVPDCDEDQMIGLVRAHLERLGYEVLDADPTPTQRQSDARLIKLTVRAGGYRGIRAPMDWEVSDHVVTAVERATGRRPIRIPNMGGSLPFFHFEDELGVHVLGVPLVNYDNNQHGPDENVRLGHLWQGYDVLATLLVTYGDARVPPASAGDDK